MALYIPHSVFHLARLSYVRPETFGSYNVHTYIGTYAYIYLTYHTAEIMAFRHETSHLSQKKDVTIIGQ